MPYKDPERKRQWEREHRRERNARRKLDRVTLRSGQASTSNAEADATRAIVARLKNQVHQPVPKQHVSGWKVLLGFAVGLGVIVLAALARLDVPATGHPGPSPGSGKAGL
jgi:hypothetical protein